MSDSEDFLFQINAEELYPEGEKGEKEEDDDEAGSPVRKKGKLEKKKKKKMKIPKLVPNHFIAFRIYDSAIKEKIADVQKKIIEKNSLLNKALIDINTLHVTLAVTHLENEERINQLKERLQDWGEKDMKTHFAEPMRLTFKGIGTFRKNVAFVKVNECENYRRLCDLASALNNLLSDSGFYAENAKKFTPHLTLLKLSKNYKLFRDNKSVASDIEALCECEDDFGCEDVRQLQLLSMLAKKDDTGYYKCLWERTMRESSPDIKTTGEE